MLHVLLTHGGKDARMEPASDKFINSTTRTQADQLMSSRLLLSVRA